MEQFRHIDTWVFDLDNTLYDAETHVFPEVERLMSEYVMRLLNVSMEEAQAVRLACWRKHGTTLRGLMNDYDIDSRDFIEKTHAVDISVVPRCEVTREKLALLPGRKILYTNAPRQWADNMTKHLGIAEHFDGFFCIEDAGLLPKPDIAAYRMFLQQHDVNPKTSCMFEDMEINLKPAHDLGMTTVWLHRGNKNVAHPHVHHSSKLLSDWLEDTVKEKK